MADLPDNPLPACPSLAWNCVRRTRSYAPPPEALFPLIEDVLLAMQPAELDMRGEENGRVRAVFPVFVFKNDVEVAVEAYADGSAVHLRSASRVGSYDFGVNRRRAKRFYRMLEETLASQ